MDDLIQTAINAICQDCCDRNYCGECFYYGTKQAIDALKALPSVNVQPSTPGQLIGGVLERNIDNIRQAGLEGKEFRFRIGGRLFAVRELPQ